MTDRDKARLRALAQQYSDYAHSKHMDERREKWLMHNRLEAKTYPFHIEDNGSFHRDLMPDGECEDKVCRALEWRLIRAITSHDYIDDDRIIPKRFVVDWSTPTTALCEELSRTHADNGRGNSLGFKTNKPIQDIDADFGKLKKRTIRLDKDATEKRAEVAREIFDGLMPVEVGRTSTHYSGGITNTAVLLMGMQELYLQMAMNPDAVARLLTFLGEDNMVLGKWEEDQKLLTLNNDGNQGYCSGSSHYSDETATVAGDNVMTTDRWGYTESQESAGISADMFDEFVMPYLTKVASKFKVLKYGCCEPVHDTITSLQRLPGLRKVSVTPWCDMQKLAENCREDVIWCRKPIPLKLNGATFSADEMREHLQETLDIGKDYFIEFVYRDTCGLTGEMADRVAQTCSIIREITGRPEGARRHG